MNNGIALVIMKQHSPWSQSGVSISKNQWQGIIPLEWHLLQSFYALTRQLAFYNFVIPHSPHFFPDFGNVFKFIAKKKLYQWEIAIVNFFKKAKERGKRLYLIIFIAEWIKAFSKNFKMKRYGVWLKTVEQKDRVYPRQWTHRNYNSV